MEIDKKVFSAKLLQLMNENKMSNYALAKVLGCSQSSVANWIDGKTKPAAGYVNALVDYFGVNLWDLIGKQELESEPTSTRADFISKAEKLSEAALRMSIKRLPSDLKFQIGNIVDLSLQHPDRASSILENAVYAFGDSNWTSENKESPGLSTEASRLAYDFDNMDKWGRKAVRGIADTELARISDIEENTDNVLQIHPAVKDIPLLGTSFAAGTGEIDTGNAWSLYTVPAASPAEFAIRINGDSMEPYLPDGSVALCKRENPRDGDVAALLIDGEFLCKQVCQDITGALHLFSLNRDRKDADRHIHRDEIDRQVICFGTVLLDKVPSLPID